MVSISPCVFSSCTRSSSSKRTFSLSSTSRSPPPRHLVGFVGCLVRVRSFFFLRLLVWFFFVCVFFASLSIFFSVSVFVPVSAEKNIGGRSVGGGKATSMARPFYDHGYLLGGFGHGTAPRAYHRAEPSMSPTYLRSPRNSGPERKVGVSRSRHKVQGAIGMKGEVLSVFRFYVLGVVGLALCVFWWSFLLRGVSGNSFRERIGVSGVCGWFVLFGVVFAAFYTTWLVLLPNIAEMFLSLSFFFFSSLLVSSSPLFVCPVLFFLSLFLFLPRHTDQVNRSRTPHCTFFWSVFSCFSSSMPLCFPARFGCASFYFCGFGGAFLGISWTWTLAPSEALFSDVCRQGVWFLFLFLFPCLSCLRLFHTTRRAGPSSTHTPQVTLPPLRII